MSSFKNYLAQMYVYKSLLKKEQYKLWEVDEAKMRSKIDSHILVFGFTEAVVHFVKATRAKTNMPIVFYCNEDI